MKITQTSYFIDDCRHYTKLAQEAMYTTKKDDIKKSIYRLERLRGKEYVNTLIAKCNQKLKCRFYEKIA